MLELLKLEIFKKIFNERIVIKYLLKFILNDEIIDDLYYLYNKENCEKAITKEEIKKKILALTINLEKFKDKKQIKNAQIEDLIITNDKKLLLYLKGIDIGIGSDERIKPKAWFLKFKNRVENKIF